MKKFFVFATALFFMTATSGLVLAQGTTSAPSKPAAGKGHKKHHPKKGKTSKTAPTTGGSAPAGK